MTESKFRGELYDWFTSRDPYRAPEQGFFLVGKQREPRTIYNGKVINAGQFIQTSIVVKAEGRRVWTESGSEYVLGDADKGFLEYLNAEGFAFDPENPLPVKKRTN